MKINDFFFFKQKTAYEEGSRDWSSDVCSSDLFNLLFSPPSLWAKNPFLDIFGLNVLAAKI